MSGDTLQSFELKENDIAPVLTIASKDQAPLRCGAPGCTNAVVKPARGRTPKFCPEHKPTNSNRSQTSGRSWVRATEIENLLTQYVGGLAMGITLLNKVDGSIIAEGGPAIVHELVELAKTDKQLRKYLEWLATPGKYAPLTIAVLGVAIPMLANHGLMPTFFVVPTSDGGEE